MNLDTLDTMLALLVDSDLPNLLLEIPVANTIISYSVRQAVFVLHCLRFTHLLNPKILAKYIHLK